MKKISPFVNGDLRFHLKKSSKTFNLFMSLLRKKLCRITEKKQERTRKGTLTYGEKQEAPKRKSARN